MSPVTVQAATVYTIGMHFRPVSDKTWLTLRRTLIILVAAVLLHALALDWANDHIEVLRGGDDAPPPVTEVQLQPPPPEPEPAKQSTPGKVAFKPKPKPRPQTATAPPAEQDTQMMADTPPAPPVMQAPPNQDSDQAAQAGADASTASKDVSGQNDQAKVNPDEKPEDNTATTRYKVEFPPSAELKYDVEKVPADGGNPSYGSGKITWQNRGGHYQVVGEASVLFFTLLKFTSEGNFDNYGIAPVLYSEKKINRSETATHFNRDDRRNISFSASTLSYPIKGGEQDTGSVIWELSGIGRGDHDKFIPGAQIDLFVAGTRDADIWSILVVGQEQIEIDHNKIPTWHVVRIPRTGSYDRKIDIWLAPQDQWYPVRIRQTEKSGDYFDMTMTSINAAPDQAAR